MQTTIFAYKNMAKPTNEKFTKIHFIGVFWLVAGILFSLKCLFPEIAGKHLKEVKELIVNIHRPGSRPVAHDSIGYAALHVDSLFHAPRRPIVVDGMAQHRPVARPMQLSKVFPDTNLVQLAVATRHGAPECENREAAARNRDSYVFIGESPYYDLENLTYSVPYLVPRAATLLDEIGRAFLDSLASKGIPFHKLVVTSVLRTSDDVTRLRRRNRNASEQSCHVYGTTVDISYNIFHRVQDPDLPPQPETYSGTLKAILAEVLDDQRRNGTCYVKYEYRQSCFHLTCR